MGTFSPQARKASMEARLRNAALRKEGLLPPTKHHRAETVPLDSPIFDKPAPKPKVKAQPGGKSDRDFAIRLIKLALTLL